MKLTEKLYKYNIICEYVMTLYSCREAEYNPWNICYYFLKYESGIIATVFYGS
jgi:hypothetical protein